MLTCTDGALTIRAAVKAEVEEEGDILLPGKLLTEIVRKLPEGVVSLAVNEKNITVIKCQQSRSTLAGMPAEDFPLMRDIINTHALHVPQKRLKDMISRVIFAIAQHESRQTLTGSLMEVTRGEIRLVGLDGFRLALQTMKGNFMLPDGKEMLKAIIPGHVMNEMSRIMGDDENAMVTFHMDQGHLMAIIGDTTVLTTLLAGEYINYRQILPTEWKTRVTVKCKEFGEAIERASLIAREGKNNLIKIKAENDMMQHHLHVRPGRRAGGDLHPPGGRGDRDRVQRPLYRRRGEEHRRRMLHALHVQRRQPLRALARWTATRICTWCCRCAFPAEANSSIRQNRRCKQSAAARVFPDREDNPSRGFLLLRNTLQRVWGGVALARAKRIPVV